MSVSLLAVAAVAVGVILSRQRTARILPVSDKIPAGEPLPAERSLEAIRAAGL